MATARIDSHTRTIQTLMITVPDDILGGVEMTNEIEVVLCSRSGSTLPRKLSYSDFHRLMGEGR